jgi:hypothetical protein
LVSLSLKSKLLLDVLVLTTNCADGLTVEICVKLSKIVNF